MKEPELSPLEKSLILCYLHSNQLTKSLDIVLHEMKVINDPRSGMFQSLLEKLRGASKRAFLNIEKNISNKDELENELMEVIDSNWDSIK